MRVQTRSAMTQSVVAFWKVFVYDRPTYCICNEVHGPMRFFRAYYLRRYCIYIYDIYISFYITSIYITLYISLYIFGFSFVVWRWFFFTLLSHTSTPVSRSRFIDLDPAAVLVPVAFFFYILYIYYRDLIVIDTSAYAVSFIYFFIVPTLYDTINMIECDAAGLHTVFLLWAVIREIC